MKMLENYLTLQRDLNIQMQKNAKGKDVLFLLFLVIFPFFTDNIFFNCIIFSIIGLIYVKFGIVKFFTDYYVKEDIDN